MADDVDAALPLRYDWQGRTVITVHNLGRRARTAKLPVDGVDDCTLRDLIRGASGPVAVRNGRARVKLEAHGYGWLQIDLRS